MADSYSPKKKRLALGKVKDFLKYENGRYRVAVLWKENKPDLPDAKPMALSKSLKKSEEKRPRRLRISSNYSGLC